MPTGTSTDDLTSNNVSETNTQIDLRNMLCCTDKETYGLFKPRENIPGLRRLTSFRWPLKVGCVFNFTMKHTLERYSNFVKTTYQNYACNISCISFLQFGYKSFLYQIIWLF